MKVIVVIDNDAYLNCDDGRFAGIQEEIYRRYCNDKQRFDNDNWDTYDHEWRTDERLVRLAENLPMFKVVKLPDNTTDFITTCHMEDNEEELFYVVDGKIYWT